ncbi:IS481 family transposase [Pseudomonas sp. R45(2017)]|uniref:IS481 family transposase n=1 Tax=unclassified Pseudomonas TaxID=196821 RepID=UPI000A1F1DC2|nr:IS481 family transposase [Pseudomonas sp. R45(2017)]MCH4897709.1 IS481 family transposase [Pseudomonas sp. B707]MCH4898163.1 IS481 family transposase [Pseudomonas sp. B707]MCH4898170.1 IS481 family transposase [Pseudomonas sp. B707]MCH4898171.1 IS481 family transposase [Pseudomonas sp. B707]MCH4899517.1 IS481 family transposase [Pseudomonas sp. B707]
MSWEEVSTVQLRTEFVLLARQEGANVRQLCRRFNISPSTAYKWLSRFEKSGAEGLNNQSRRPKTSPKRCADEVEKQILNVSQEYAAWGARKLKRVLEDKGLVMPSVSTVHAVLQRHSRVDPKAAEIKPFIRFEHDAPNDLWQMDFKGHVGMRHGRCHPLTILDDHSRFSLCIAACANQQRQTVEEQLVGVFRRYGLPQRMTMDNGSPWGDQTGVYTALEVWLMRQGIRVSHSRPYHPQTQGKIERFHRSLKAEVLQSQCFIDLVGAQKAFDIWRETYNQKRPHQALGMGVPASRYSSSPLEYQETRPVLEYAEGDLVRKVQGNGEMYWRSSQFLIGKAFIGELIAIRGTTEDGIYDVYWSRHRIARIDLIQQTVVSGKRI